MLSSGCISTKYTGIRKISFGTGGGATGKIEKYTLNINGDLSKSIDKYGRDSIIVKIPKKKVNEIFKEVKTMCLDTLNYCTPENFYNYIDIESVEKNNHICWFNNSSELDVNLNKMHKKLNNLLNK